MMTRHYIAYGELPSKCLAFLTILQITIHYVKILRLNYVSIHVIQ